MEEFSSDSTTLIRQKLVSVQLSTVQCSTSEKEKESYIHHNVKLEILVKGYYILIV